MWAVVHFSFDNSVEPVPSYWLSKDGRLCAWPNNDNLAKKMRANRTAPNKLEFTYYKCRVISKNIGKLIKNIVLTYYIIILLIFRNVG